MVRHGEVFVILASFHPGKCDVFMRDRLGLPIYCVAGITNVQAWHC